MCKFYLVYIRWICSYNISRWIKNTIEGSKLVVQKTTEADRKSQKVKVARNASGKSNNVQTGVESLAGTLATLTAAIGGLFASKKKKRK